MISTIEVTSNGNQSQFCESTFYQKGDKGGDKLNRVSVFVRRRRIKNLEHWTLYAILTEAFFLALSPTVAAAAVMFGIITFFLRIQIDSKYKT